MKRTRFGLGALALTLLAGCGGAGGADAFVNLLSLDGGDLAGISRAADTNAPTADQTCTRTFPDQSFPGRGNGNGRPGGPPPGLSRWRIGQGISRSVRVSVPEGATLPASFTLTNVALTLRITDGDRVVERTATVAGPLAFTRSGQSDIYVTRDEIAPEVVFTDGSFETLHAILSTAPSPNTSTVTLRYDASAELPAGATLRFALQRGKGHLQ